MGEANRKRKAREQYEAQPVGSRLGDGPVDLEYHAKMQAIMQTVDEFMNDCASGSDRQVGIVILTFPLGATDGRCNFMSNGADRRDLVVMFKEMISRFEGQPAVKGNA